jgi:ribonuclease-3
MNPTARQALEAALGHRFVRQEHLQVALTHDSFGEAPDNEKLEFLGDAVLELAISDLLMNRFPTAREGELSKMRAALVNAESLARKAREIGLGQWLQLGRARSAAAAATSRRSSAQRTRRCSARSTWTPATRPPGASSTGTSAAR